MDTQIIGIAAGICTASSVIPQFVKSLKEKKASDVSPIMFLVLMAGNGLWAYYGIIKDDFPIIITNAFSFMMDVAMLFLKYKYRKNKRPDQ